MNYYDLLGLAPNASADEVKLAYRRLAKKCHPDLFQQSGEMVRQAALERFKQINEANAVLSDPGRRANYDSMLMRRATAPGAPPRYRTPSEIRKAHERAAAHAREKKYQAQRRSLAEKERARREAEAQARRAAEQEQQAQLEQARQVVPLMEGVTLTLLRIPSGKFYMGSERALDRQANPNELPAHWLFLPEFYASRAPITNTHYALFVRATGHPPPAHWRAGAPPDDKAEHPVTGVSWFDAVAFCQWLSALTGQPFRLPTEAEWEKAARGPERLIYPWGNQWDRWRLNTGDVRRTEHGWETDTTPVGQFSPEGDSPYGLVDMAGNVWEWCQSEYRPYPYDPADGREMLTSDALRVLRGGTLSHARRVARCAYRYHFLPINLGPNIGFRVVRA